MVKPRGGYLAGLALAALAAGWLWYSGRSPSTTVTAVPTGRGQRSRTGEIPRIDLARLAGPRPQAQVGRRDLFSFGAARVEAGSAAPPPPTVAVAPPSPVFTGPPPPPPMNLKYIGNLESKQGLKVAVLMTDRKEVLTGQVGELVANRFRIVKIGLESVDIQEVPDGRVRRIPLRGN
jgi:hypothetical protein